MVREEAGTTAWFGIRSHGRGSASSTCSPDDEGRQAHLSGPVADALTTQAAHLFAGPPDITYLDVLADKLPAGPPPAAPVAPGPVTKALLLTFKAKASKDGDVEELLRGAQYGIFDVFPDSNGRLAHLAGRVPRALAKNALSLVGSVPDMKMIDVLADKLPG